MDRRTALISAASVVGVVLAGSTAVAANVGILDQADNTGIGELSASVDMSAVAPRVIDVQLDPQRPSPTVVRIDDGDSSEGSGLADEVPGQPFIVEDAGVVTIETSAKGLRLAEVTPNGGWTYLEHQTEDGTVSVTFDSDTATYVFTASLRGDGSIDASVDQPIIEFVTTPAPALSGNGSSSVDDDGDHGDDDDDHDHEGRDDDGDDGDDDDDDDRDDDEEHEEDDHGGDDDDHDDDDDHEGRDDDD